MNGYQLIKLGKNEVLEQIYDIEYSRTISQSFTKHFIIIPFIEIVPFINIINTTYTLQY